MSLHSDAASQSIATSGKYVIRAISISIGTCQKNYIQCGIDFETPNRTISAVTATFVNVWPHAMVQHITREHKEIALGISFDGMWDMEICEHLGTSKCAVKRGFKRLRKMYHETGEVVLSYGGSIRAFKVNPALYAIFLATTICRVGFHFPRYGGCWM